MMKRLELFDWENRYSRINTDGNPSVKLNKVIDGETFMMLSEKWIIRGGLMLFS